MQSGKRLVFPSCRGAGHGWRCSAGPRRAGGGWAALFGPTVDVSAASVHEEVAYGGKLKAQLLRDGDLQVFGRSVVLSKNGQESATLQVCED